MMSASATQGGLNNKLTAEISRFFFTKFTGKCPLVKVRRICAELG